MFEWPLLFQSTWNDAKCSLFRAHLQGQLLPSMFLQTTTELSRQVRLLNLRSIQVVTIYEVLTWQPCLVTREMHSSQGQIAVLIVLDSSALMMETPLQLLQFPSSVYYFSNFHNTWNKPRIQWLPLSYILIHMHIKAFPVHWVTSLTFASFVLI